MEAVTLDTVHTWSFINCFIFHAIFQNINFKIKD